MRGPVWQAGRVLTLWFLLPGPKQSLTWVAGLVCFSHHLVGLFSSEHVSASLWYRLWLAGWLRPTVACRLALVWFHTNLSTAPFKASSPPTSCSSLSVVLGLTVYEEINNLTANEIRILTQAGSPLWAGTEEFSDSLRVPWILEIWNCFLRAGVCFRDNSNLGSQILLAPC